MQCPTTFRPAAELARAAELVAAPAAGSASPAPGVSAESGTHVPRPDGLWRQYDPYQGGVRSAASDAIPRVLGTWPARAGACFRQAEPNRGHLAIAAMEEDGHLAGVVTQNTTGCTGNAGTRALIELHGNGRTVRCLTAARRSPAPTCRPGWTRGCRRAA